MADKTRPALRSLMSLEQRTRSTDHTAQCVRKLLRLQADLHEEELLEYVLTNALASERVEAAARLRDSILMALAVYIKDRVLPVQYLAWDFNNEEEREAYVKAAGALQVLLKETP